MAAPSILEELNKMRESVEKAYTEQDFDRASTVWAPDCKFMDPGKPIQTGREVARASLDVMWQNGIRRMTMVIEDAVSTGPGWAYAYGSVNFFLGNGTQLPGVTFVNIYERDSEGKFRVKVDCANVLK